MLHRLLASSSSERLRPREEVIEPCEEVEDGQPHNPYTEILVLQHHSDIIRILLRINDRRFVSAGDDNKAVIWEVQYGKRIATLMGHTHPITCLLVMPADDDNEEPVIISGSSDKQIRIWDSENGECRQVLIEHGASVRSMQPLGPGLFSAGGENLSLWNLNGDLLHFIGNSAQEDVHLMISIRQERIITAADKELFAYKLKHEVDQHNSNRFELIKLKQLQSHREAIHSLVSVSTSCFASGSVDGMIIIWTASNLQPARRLNAVTEYEGANRRFPYSVQSMMCVQERYLFAAVGCGFYVFEINAEKEHLVVQKKSAHFSKVTCMGFASEGEFLVTCSEDKCLRLWGKKPSTDHWNARDGMAVTTMEKFTGLQSQELHQVSSQYPWEPSLLGELSAHGGSVQGFLDFDHEGIVSCGADGVVIIWKNAEMQHVRRNQTVRKLLLSSDGIV
ncbi:WD repeat-containing protein 41 [Aplysia californica]|uniref:WD repeat-containing protein 41 n=1 Tax=Aplysia californica TaxID=6500 RepID=A0ABM0JCR4_APLCA|nr:WD repeat-containing protein 41 [Aplysia californica]